MFAKRFLPIVLAALVLPTASGCSKSYTFDLTVTVVSAADGKPIPNALVSLDFIHSKTGEPPPQTDASGRYVQRFSVGIYDFDGSRLAEPWNLKIERDGYVSQTVNIKPATKPANYDSTPLDVVVRLEPAKAP